MASVNKCIIVGNLGADPEIRHMQNGDPVANLSVATSEGWNDKATGEKVTKTEWHHVVIFGGIAKIAEQYLHKGSKVYLEGQLQTRKWQDQSGADRYSTEIVLQGFGGKLVMLDSGEGMTQGGRRTDAPSNAKTGDYGQQQPGQGVSDELDDEIPF